MTRSLTLMLGLVLTGLTLGAGWFYLRPDADLIPGGAAPIPAAGTATGEPDAAQTETVTYLVTDRASFRAAGLAPELTQALSRAEPANIRVETYTDTLLAAQASRAMTALWAAEVRELLVLLGADPTVITVTAHGETSLAVETDDGIREPANRRVVVTVVYDELLHR